MLAILQVQLSRHGGSGSVSVSISVSISISVSVSVSISISVSFRHGKKQMIGFQVLRKILIR